VEVFQDLGDGAVVRVLGDAVASQVAALRYEDIEDPQSLLGTGVRHSIFFDRRGGLSGEEV
jgi:hypothetical protein